MLIFVVLVLYSVLPCFGCALICYFLRWLCVVLFGELLLRCVLGSFWLALFAVTEDPLFF